MITASIGGLSNWSSGSDATHLKASPIHIGLLKYGVRAWSITCSNVNGTPATGTLKPYYHNYINLPQYPDSAEPAFTDLITSEFDPRLYGANGTAGFYATDFICEELIGIEEDTSNYGQLVMSFPAIVQGDILSAGGGLIGNLGDVLGIHEEGFIQSFLGGEWGSSTNPSQPFSLLNSTYQPEGYPVFGWAYPSKVTVILKAYGVEWVVDEFPNTQIQWMWAPSYPGDPEAQFAAAMAPITITIEATEYWSYGGRWNTSTGMSA